MVFSSETFLFLFLPLFLALYYRTPFRFRSALILAGSYLFYGWWRFDFLLLLFLTTLWTYGFGRLIGTNLGTARAKLYCAIGTAGCLSVPGVFKYLNFFIDSIAALADLAFATSDPTAPLAWIGAIAYMLQLYFDFSGYSDMAIGLGWMMGFKFRDNFDAPCTSGSITEFWRRWHISLSVWLRDYPLDPNRGRSGGKSFGRLRIDRLGRYRLRH